MGSRKTWWSHTRIARTTFRTTCAPGRIHCLTAISPDLSGKTDPSSCRADHGPHTHRYQRHQLAPKCPDAGRIGSGYFATYREGENDRRKKERHLRPECGAVVALDGLRGEQQNPRSD